MVIFFGPFFFGAGRAGPEGGLEVEAFAEPEDGGGSERPLFFGGGSLDSRDDFDDVAAIVDVDGCCCTPPSLSLSLSLSLP